MLGEKIILATKLILTLGSPFTLPGQPKQVWIENSQILKAESKNGRTLLRPQKAGFSTIKTEQGLFEVSVLTPQDNKFMQLIKPPIGLNKSVELGSPQIAGELFRFADLKKILDLSNSLRSRMRVRARLSANLQNEYMSYVQEGLKARGLKDFKLSWQNIGEEKILTTRMNRKLDSSSLKFYESMGVTVEDSEALLAQEPTVKVAITVAEVQRTFTQKIGLKPPISYNATVLSNHALQDESGFNLDLHALEAQGHAKILASPNILCRSGREAEFFAGGEFPIKILNYKTQDVVWKKFGISLKVKPLADASGQLSLSLETEVSSLDPSTTVDGIPGVTANRVSSHFDLKESRTIALSGLLKEESGDSSEGWPWLRRIPILGLLFSSQDYRDNKTELVIFVRPEILADDSNSSNLTRSHLEGSLPE